jgi:hypothetical protein
MAWEITRSGESGSCAALRDRSPNVWGLLRLDHVMERALADEAAGRTTPFPPLDDEQGE